MTKTVSSNATAPPSFKIENALTTTSLGTVGGNNLNHDFEIKHNEVWNLNLEHVLGRGTVLSLAYIGSRTLHADSSTVQNVALPVPGAIAARRPVPQLSQFNTIRSDGWASYHAFAVGLKRRFSRRLTFRCELDVVALAGRRVGSWSHAQ